MTNIYILRLARLTLLIFILFLACNFCIYNKKNEKLIGNWYYYEPDSVYNECYIHNDSAIFFYNLLRGKQCLNYKLKNDSLFLFNETVLNKFYLKKITDERVILEQNDSIIITLNRINKKINFSKLNSNDISKRNEFYKKFLYRAQNISNSCK